jgi:quercetin dioxygenase-like cupin family protein
VDERGAAVQSFGNYQVVSHHEFPESSLRVLRLGPGQEIPAHYHNACSQSYLTLEGAIEVRVGAAHQRINAGDAVRVPTGVVHSVRPLGGAAVVLSVSVPPLRADDHFPVSGAGEEAALSRE